MIYVKLTVWWLVMNNYMSSGQSIIVDGYGVW